MNSRAISDGQSVPLRIGLLGSVQAIRSGVDIELGPARQRAVFCVLAMRAGHTVGRDEVVDAVWGEDAPASAEGGVYTYISGLRRVLDKSGRERIGAAGSAQGSLPSAGSLLADRSGFVGSSGSGYTLRVDPDAVDALLSARLREEAQTHLRAGEREPALNAIDRALALWRGEAFAGVPGPYAMSQRVRLDEMRIELLEQRAGVLLEIGGQQEAATELSGLVLRYPMRESLRELLMRALYRCGRTADALEVFRSARKILADELGIEPGPRLRQLHQQILTGDPSIGADEASSAVASTSIAVPGSDALVPTSTVVTTESGAPAEHAELTRAPLTLPIAQLPHDVAAFTGRDRELAWLHDLLTPLQVEGADGSSSGDGAPEAPVWIASIDGCGGVGKTALALRFAHQIGPKFPDGQLWVDLRGFDPVLPPLHVAEALVRLLRGLGQDPKQLPDDVDSLAALYRTVLAGRRIIVLLDNAISTDQVQHLLPGTYGCLAVVTSRNRLGSLVARHGAHRLTLDVLEPEEAHGLLVRLLGRSRVEEEAAAAAELIGLCGGFPLALRIAAERIVARCAEPIGDLLAELREECDRLDVLSIDEDPTGAVRNVFSWSYQALKPEAARLFRLLALHPGAEFSAAAAAALDGQSPGNTNRFLRTLADGHLLEPVGTSRYRIHDMLRLYADELIRSQDSETDRDAASVRMLAFYLNSIDNATRRIQPGSTAGNLDPPPTGCETLDFVDATVALDWVDREQTNLQLAVRHASHTGHDRLCWQLADRLRLVYELHRTGAEWLATTTVGLDAARRCGDQRGEAQLRYRHGLALTLKGDAAGAVADLEAAEEMYASLDDYRGTANTRNGIAIVYAELLGRPDLALSHFAAAGQLFKSAGDRDGYARVVGNTGRAQIALGHYDNAIAHVEESVRIFEELGNVVSAVRGRMRRAQAEVAAGRPEVALPIFVDIYDDHRETLGTSWLHDLLLGRTMCHRALGEHQLAIEWALKTIEAAGDGAPTQRAGALYEMACAYRGLGDLGEARSRTQQAVAILDAVGNERADQLRAELAAMSTGIAAAMLGSPGR